MPFCRHLDLPISQSYTFFLTKSSWRFPFIENLVFGLELNCLKSIIFFLDPLPFILPFSSYFTPSCVKFTYLLKLAPSRPKHSTAKWHFQQPTHVSVQSVHEVCHLTSKEVQCLLEIFHDFQPRPNVVTATFNQVQLIPPPELGRTSTVESK